MRLNELEVGYRHMSGKMPFFRTDGVKGYHRTAGNTKSFVYPEEESGVDKQIEQQLIDRAIDILFNEHPELVQNKTIRRMNVQMLIGKITSGEVNDLITMKQMIKSLKKRGIKVESKKMKIKKSDLKLLIREVLTENEHKSNVKKC